MQLDGKKEKNKKKEHFLTHLKSLCIKKEMNAKQVSFMLLLDEHAAVYILHWLCSQSEPAC